MPPHTHNVRSSSTSILQSGLERSIRRCCYVGFDIEWPSLPVEVPISRGIFGDELGSCSLCARLRRHRVSGQSQSQCDGVVPKLHLCLEPLEEPVPVVLVDLVATISRDQDVAIPTISGRTPSVLGDSLLHVGLIPVNLTLGVAHIEGVHELESQLLCGSVRVFDSIGDPNLVIGTIWRDPVQGKAVNSNVLSGGNVGFPLIDVVGVAVHHHEVSEDSGSRGGLQSQRQR